MINSHINEFILGTHRKIPKGFSYGGVSPAINFNNTVVRWGAANVREKIIDSQSESIFSSHMQRGPNGHVEQQLAGVPQDSRPNFERSESGRVSMWGRSPGTPRRRRGYPVFGRDVVEGRSSGVPNCAEHNLGQRESAGPARDATQTVKVQPRIRGSHVCVASPRQVRQGAQRPRTRSARARRSTLHLGFKGWRWHVICLFSANPLSYSSVPVVPTSILRTQHEFNLGGTYEC